MKILVPVDYSDFSRIALTEAVAWAEDTGGSLSLLHVIPVTSWLSHDHSELRSDLRHSAEEKLEALRNELLGDRIPSTLHILEGTPHTEIVRFAAKTSVDHIAIGTRGLSGLDHFFLGSTAERVVRTARCPILMVRDPGDDTTSEPRRGPRSLRRILFATDFSTTEDHAQWAALRFAEMSGAEVLLMHVLDYEDYTSYDVLPADSWDLARQQCEQNLHTLATWSFGSVPSRTLLIDGVPSSAINVAARDHGVDLIVVAPSSRDSHLPGATADRIVRGAPCSVYLAKRTEPLPH